MKKTAYFLFMCLFACSQSEKLPEGDIVEESKVQVSEEVAQFSESSKSQVSEVPEYDTWTFEKMDDSNLVFKEGPVFDTELHELEYIGQIDIDGKAPFLVFSGRHCDECDANTSLYFHSPRNGYLNVSYGENRYLYPGKERDYETDSLLYEARAFYGEVFKGVSGIVWFQKTLMEDNSIQNSVYLAKIVGDKVVAEEVKDFNDRLKEALELNKAGKNKEIKGREYTSEP
ncbi:hypothetical protein [Pontibacter lucknowensis]|uniref:Uncharacterized protein n=1 Tax=Pontibacter lucknowensis TaxID=1077936 RepID=A0A1N7BG45_9BACT|nr:hypothetical protein [Pontibacter lucknowensis]SIR50317.1 hypothetical protein SAMN05421545_3956 [Pontibacter lucknowensis]